MAASNYTIASFPGSKEEWYHGEESRTVAEQALKTIKYDCFLVRQSRQRLVLSIKNESQIYHIKIEYGPDRDGGWYSLYGCSHNTFRSVPDLVSHYRRTPISTDSSIMLGLACPMARSTFQKGTGKITNCY
jgi:hypothetical protein